MTDPQAATETQLRNIQAQTGKTVEDFTADVRARGPLTHGQIITLLKSEHGLSHGNANLIAHQVREALAGGPASAEDLLAAQYAGAKAALRPVHDRLVAIATGLGTDVSIVTQKTGVSLRRRRQFGVIGAPSGGRIALGLNLDATPDDPRVVATAGAMCSQRVDLRSLDAVDAEVERWLAQAYERAG
jgi:hypothetical protein